MKTIKLILMSAALFTVGFFTSCTDDTVATGPTVAFVAGDGIITADATVETGASFTFKWLVTQGTAKLSEFTIRVSNTDVDGFPKTDIPADSYTDQFTTSQANAGVYAYTFIATDKDGMEDTKTITVTVTAPAALVTSYTDKILGADNNATLGSSFASMDGSVYLLAAAKDNAAKVDFVYFYGTTNKATLAAPGDADAQTVYNSATSGIATWSVKNATVFGTTSITAAAFDAITTETEVIAAATGLTASKVNNLAVGNVIAFQTAATSTNASKKGLIKIVALTAEKVGEITIAVKVQQ